jgi:methylmalonyl-CoA/ethylmalonyl-CoA epimerase
VVLNRIDHLGIAVENLKQSIAAYEALGLELADTEEVAEQKVNVAMFPCGESRIELLESTDPDGPIGKFITKRGPGIHHVAFGVDDISATLAELAANGVRLIDQEPRIGAGGAKIAFVHPAATGILIEICQHDTDGVHGGPTDRGTEE